MNEPQAIVPQITLFIICLSLNALSAMAEASLSSGRRLWPSRVPASVDAGTAEPTDAALMSNSISALRFVMIFLTALSAVAAGSILLDEISSLMTNSTLPAETARWLAVVVTGLVTATLTLIFGEILPKKIAANAPEKFIQKAVTPIVSLVRFLQPAANLLEKMIDALCRFLGLGLLSNARDEKFQEIKTLLEESAKTGALGTTGQRMVEGVIEFSQARISSFMTPRPEVVWLDIDDPAEKNRKKISDARHSHFPVVKGSPDNVVGVIHVKDILSRQLLGEPFDLTLFLEQALFLPETADASRSVELFRNSATHFAFVVDEYGNIQGVLTLTDILRAIVGDFADTMDDKSTTILKRQDGSWVVDGLVTVQELREKLKLPKLRGEDSGNFHTIAGFILSELGKIPRTADSFESDGIRYEVIDMDGNRVDKVLITFPREGHRR